MNLKILSDVHEILTRLWYLRKEASEKLAQAMDEDDTISKV